MSLIWRRSIRFWRRDRNFAARSETCFEISDAAGHIPTYDSNLRHTRTMKTAVLPVDVHNIGSFTVIPSKGDVLDSFHLELATNDSDEATHLRTAAEKLRESDTPVAFPTETVYGLGADATRSSAVNGIYKAKRRPADNPLIVHFASLDQLREVLRPSKHKGDQTNGPRLSADEDPIPAIYRPVISRFWPGPLTIILPNSTESPLAPEVTAGLKTFGARIPRHALALALIRLADRPIAAPSANASTKPSPTAAEHVAHDLDGRIEIIVDGGPCDVGVESTVVDGLSRPPQILRPGGVSLEQLKLCPGWEDTGVAYKNVAEAVTVPTAPGMKYRHYSPKASVILHDAGTDPPGAQQLRNALGRYKKIGVITTGGWKLSPNTASSPITIVNKEREPENRSNHEVTAPREGFSAMLDALQETSNTMQAVQDCVVDLGDTQYQLLAVALGSSVVAIARGIFAALRELDRCEVDAIFVEGISDSEGDTAAAVMNRLRKAAEVKVGE